MSKNHDFTALSFDDLGAVSGGCKQRFESSYGAPCDRSFDAWSGGDFGGKEQFFDDLGGTSCDPGGGLPSWNEFSEWAGNQGFESPCGDARGEIFDEMGPGGNVFDFDSSSGFGSGSNCGG